MGELFVEKVIKKQKISKEAIKRAGGMDAINADLANWVCVTVDDDYAFVAKEFVEEQYSLKRAVKVGTVSASSSDGVRTGIHRRICKTVPWKPLCMGRCKPYPWY